MDIGFETLEQCSRVSLPMELIFSCILPKLPAKSLLRFKSVSKSFSTEISSPRFNELFSEANHGLLILPGQNHTFRIYDMDSLCSPPTLCPYPILSKRNEYRMSLLACCESYLLFGIGATQRVFLMLLNPATRIYRIIITQDYNPRWSESDYVQYGMCHCSDEFNNDYFKVARFFQYNDPQGYSRLDITVYSLRTNLSIYTVCKTATTGVLIENPVLVQNHLLAMLCYGSDRFMRIGCFNIKAERWSNDVPLSDILLGEIGSNPTRDGDHHLGVLEGQLRFSCYDENKSTYNIWVMKNFGVKSSWFKLMSFPVQGTQHVYHPIAYRKGSLHELLCIPNESGKYLWYNLRDKQFTETGLDGYGLNRNVRGFAFIYKESMLNFPGGQFIEL